MHGVGQESPRCTPVLHGPYHTQPSMMSRKLSGSRLISGSSNLTSGGVRLRVIHGGEWRERVSAK